MKPLTYQEEEVRYKLYNYNYYDQYDRGTDLTDVITTIIIMIDIFVLCAFYYIGTHPEFVATNGLASLAITGIGIFSLGGTVFYAVMVTVDKEQKKAIREASCQTNTYPMKKELKGASEVGIIPKPIENININKEEQGTLKKKWNLEQ